MEHAAFYCNAYAAFWVARIHDARNVARDHSLEQSTRGWAESMVHEGFEDSRVRDPVEGFDGVEETYDDWLLCSYGGV